MKPVSYTHLYVYKRQTQLGAIVVAVSDSDGYVVDESGIDYRHLKDVKEKRRERLTAYADERGSARHVTGGSIWDVPCDIALPLSLIHS